MFLFHLYLFLLHLCIQSQRVSHWWDFICFNERTLQIFGSMNRIAKKNYLKWLKMQQWSHMRETKKNRYQQKKHTTDQNADTLKFLAAVWCDLFIVLVAFRKVTFCHNYFIVIIKCELCCFFSPVCIRVLFILTIDLAKRLVHVYSTTANKYYIFRLSNSAC